MYKMIVIASHLPQTRASLVDALRQYDWKLMSDIENGYELFDCIKLHMPDVVVADYEMPGFDPEQMVEYFEKTMVKPPSFVLIGSQSALSPIHKHALEKRHLYLTKPFEAEALLEFVTQCPKTLTAVVTSEEERYRKLVAGLLQRMRTPPHVFGYACLRDAITYMILHPDYHQIITKVIYAEIAELHNTSKTHVERAIRSTIEIVWDQGNKDVLRQYFGYGPNQELLDPRRPSNSKFMAAIAEALRLEKDAHLKSIIF